MTYMLTYVDMILHDNPDVHTNVHMFSTGQFVSLPDLLQIEILQWSQIPNTVRQFGRGGHHIGRRLVPTRIY